MGRPKTWDRREVLRRATRLFWEKGFEGTHLQELVQVAGINRFALYKEFGGKQGLFEESLRNYMGDMESLTSVLARAPLGRENIRALLRAFDAYDFHHGCFVLNTVREKHAVGAGAWSATREFVHAGEEAFRRNVEAARDRGEIPRGADVEGLARFLVALNIGLITYRVAVPECTERGRALDVLDAFLASISGGER